MSVPLHVPPGYDTHLAYVLDEAEQAFLRGDTGLGIVGLLHALHVKDCENEPLPADFFDRIAKASDAWGLAVSRRRQS